MRAERLSYVTLGDSKTLVIHPATTTHQQLTTEEQYATGVTPDLIRVGLPLTNLRCIERDAH